MGVTNILFLFHIFGLRALMFRFTGILRYSTNNSGRFGQYVNVDFSVSFFPGQFSMRIQDENRGTIHSLANRRFNYQARDSPEDLLARDKWRSHWYDRFTGPLYLKCPSGLSGIPRELSVTVICSWDPAFCIVEYRLDDTYYQFSCRPPRGSNRWHRRSEWTSIFDSIQEDPPESCEPASDSRNPPPDSESSEDELPPPIGHHNHQLRRGVIDS